jgi:hypothetical protein
LAEARLPSSLDNCEEARPSHTLTNVGGARGIK